MTLKPQVLNVMCCSTAYAMVKTLSCTTSGNQEYIHFTLESFGVPRGTTKCNCTLRTKQHPVLKAIQWIAKQSCELAHVNLPAPVGF